MNNFKPLNLSKFNVLTKTEIIRAGYIFCSKKLIQRNTDIEIKSLFALPIRQNLNENDYLELQKSYSSYFNFNLRDIKYRKFNLIENIELKNHLHHIHNINDIINIYSQYNMMLSHNIGKIIKSIC